MEETWELAVVSKVANEKVTLRASYVDWDWSSKHTRLRYQLVISAIIFFLLAVYENSGVRFPFLLIEFDPNSEPKKPLVLLSIGLFYTFTLMSFSVRTVNERKLLSPKYEILIDKLTSIDTSFKRLYFGGSGADIRPSGDWGEAGEVFSNLPRYISDIEELVESESQQKKNVFWERELLGYWAPLIFSLSLFTSALIIFNCKELAEKV